MDTGEGAEDEGEKTRKQRKGRGVSWLSLFACFGARHGGRGERAVGKRARHERRGTCFLGQNRVVSAVSGNPLLYAVGETSQPFYF
jgi:hypothetical protein